MSDRSARFFACLSCSVKGVYFCALPVILGLCVYMPPGRKFPKLTFRVLFSKAFGLSQALPEL